MNSSPTTNNSNIEKVEIERKMSFELDEQTNCKDNIPYSVSYGCDSAHLASCTTEGGHHLSSQLSTATNTAATVTTSELVPPSPFGISVMDGSIVQGNSSPCHSPNFTNHLKKPPRIDSRLNIVKFSHQVLRKVESSLSTKSSSLSADKVVEEDQELSIVWSQNKEGNESCGEDMSEISSMKSLLSVTSVTSSCVINDDYFLLKKKSGKLNSDAVEVTPIKETKKRRKHRKRGIVEEIVFPRKTSV